MIDKVFYVYDYDQAYDTEWGDRHEAEQRAQALAESNGYTHGVMLRVPVGGTDMLELRAVTVYDEGGREVFSTNVYDSELVSA